MEQLRAELSHLLGEKLSRIECVNEKADSALWSLYDSQGIPMPLMARSFTTPGVAQQLAWKTSMLARSGTVRMPVIYGGWQFRLIRPVCTYQAAPLLTDKLNSTMDTVSQDRQPPNVLSP